eukprot:GHVT01007219.1.p1 GENE.GHVT01007219.1~~GHVT01007219.1.p1  ORF type:complete len:698 (+),score=77.35 GHVT01007219.1:381-2474(+)
MKLPSFHSGKSARATTMPVAGEPASSEACKTGDRCGPVSHAHSSNKVSERRKLARLSSASYIGSSTPIGGLHHGEPEEAPSLETGKSSGEIAYEFVDMHFDVKEDEVDFDLFDRVGWETPLNVTVEPGPYTLPEEILSFEPTKSQIQKHFFVGTSKQQALRQIYFHQQLTPEEEERIQTFRKFCQTHDKQIPCRLEPLISRLVYFNFRKFPDEYLRKTLDHAELATSWRRDFFPLSDTEEELRQDVDRGIMYWAARDESLRPLVCIKLSRLPRTATPERFKRLTIFCFEWALRYLMIPGKVETCAVLMDVRGVPLHQFPISALTDMVGTLTKQYPFRLNKMWIINDSFFVQTVWSIAKQFLTEVQQQKMAFFRSGFQQELLKEYAASQLETSYGGTRANIETFYPFPMAPGPFTCGAKTTAAPDAVSNIHNAVQAMTTFGIVWEGDRRPPIPWAPAAAEIFEGVGLPSPFPIPPVKKEEVPPCAPIEQSPLADDAAHGTVSTTVEAAGGFDGTSTSIDSAATFVAGVDMVGRGDSLESDDMTIGAVRTPHQESGAATERQKKLEGLEAPAEDSPGTKEYVVETDGEQQISPKLHDVVPVPGQGPAGDNLSPQVFPPANLLLDQEGPRPEEERKFSPVETNTKESKAEQPTTAPTCDAEPKLDVATAMAPAVDELPTENVLIRFLRSTTSSEDFPRHS